VNGYGISSCIFLIIRIYENGDSMEDGMGVVHEYENSQYSCSNTWLLSTTWRKLARKDKKLCSNHIFLEEMNAIDNLF